MRKMINSTVRVKQMNIELVKEALRPLECGTKLVIAEKTGLSIATCGNILRELVKTGEVLELELEESNGGRPARRFCYNADYRYIVCLYIIAGREIQSVTYVVTNLIGSIIEQETKNLEDIDYNKLEQLICGLIEKYSNVEAIGIGIPGVIRNGVIGVCDAEKLTNIAIVDMLQKKLSIRVTVENDMNSTVYGFYRQGIYEEESSIAVICYFKDNYPGAGIITNGHIVRGNSNFAGEVSFLDYGMPKKDLLEQINQPDKFISIVVKSIISMIAIINPETIILTGELFQKEHLIPIRQRCLKFIPKEHMPKLLIHENMETDYMNGLIAIALENLSCEVTLVEKRI